MNKHFFSNSEDWGYKLLNPIVTQKSNKILFPIFIPFAGCKQRCIFCAQEKQTGQIKTPIYEVLEKANIMLTHRHQKIDIPVEIAFFGGTFTSLEKEEFELCLEFTQKWKNSGVADSFRCSTRPDAVSEATLSQLEKHGFHTIELGIQSFSKMALTRTCRGYSPETAIEACLLVKKMGFSLGVQLMPGIPGQSLQDAHTDIHIACSLAPTFVRLYPCLVIKGTPLATLWYKNEYVPWHLNETALFLSHAYLSFWERGIPIIRTGIAKDQGLSGAILSGPWHGSLGNAVKGTALALYLQKNLHTITKSIALKDVSALDEKYFGIPRQLQGDFWGYKKQLIPFYNLFSITPKTTFWTDSRSFIISKKLIAELPANCDTFKLPPIFRNDEDTNGYF